jgi:ATP-dependent Lhr-like helicase
LSVFSRLSPRLQQSIVARLGWSSLRPVQELAGEALLGGSNAVVLAPTAGGKTEASIFPTLSLLLDNPAEGVGALYIAPIKALLNNQADRLGLYTEMVGLKRFVWHGDTTSHERRTFLREPAELLMTTPESLEVMLVSEKIDTRKLFGDLRIVIIDEIHALAGTDRGAHLISVLERIAMLSRHDVQRVGLSATVGNPAAILQWLQGTSKRPGVIVDPPKQPARRQLLVARRPELADLAADASKVARGGKSLFFCQSRSVTEAVAEHMRRAGTAVFVHHSAVSLEERTLAEERFHHGTDACIVCTSTLELGIDVGDLDRVLQHEAPDTVSSFLQRMGRTGRRAGQVANTTFFCETGAGVVQAIALIELAKAGWVEPVELSDRCWPVLVHQVLAMALAEEGVPPEAAWTHLSQVPRLQGHPPRGVRAADRVDATRPVAGAARRAAADRAQGRAQVRAPQLHGAVCGVLEPAELQRRDDRGPAARHAQPGLRRSHGRERELLLARRTAVGGAPDLPTTIDD